MIAHDDRGILGYGRMKDPYTSFVLEGDELND